MKTDIFITDNSTVVFYHLKICIEDLAFDDKLTIILKENSRPAETETTFYPSKLGPLNVRIHAKPHNISIVQCYAPTINANDE